MPDMTEAQWEEYLNNVRLYIWNIMGFEGEFSKEAFSEKIQEKPITEKFTDFKPEDYYITLNHLITGYGNFGVDFITKVIEKDKDSLVKMFECITQEYLDLKHSVDEFTDKLAEARKEADNASSEETEENKK